ncbi:MAG TPA: orotate phosphoribosyltransferase, partial [Thermoplasmata archaeon]|nr:orotate phosphoribosyltransferase [Thermoplasmata archaeon]
KTTGALRFGEFTLASGKTSPYYVDIKKAVTKPEVLRAIGRGIAKYAHRADRIAGVELGAVPIAAVVALETGKPFVMVRKERKDHGTSKDYEGDLVAGDRLLFVEDVVTTGGTLMKAVERMRAAGADVTEAVAVVDREEGGKEALAAIGVTLRALVTSEELMQVAKSGTRSRSLP